MPMFCWTSQPTGRCKPAVVSCDLEGQNLGGTGHEGLALHGLRRIQGFSGKTNSKYLILLVFGFTLLLHRGCHPLLCQAGEDDPPSSVPQNHGSQCFPRGLDCAALDTEAQVSDDKYFPNPLSMQNPHITYPDQQNGLQCHCLVRLFNTG